MTMTILTPPSLTNTVKTATWKLVSNTQTYASPLSQVTQTAEMPGARWGVTLAFENRQSAEHRAWLVFLAKMRGASGRCYLSPVFAYPFTGLGGGSPLVKGASQTGTSLNIDGCTHNATGWIKAGDFFSFDSGTGRELKLCTADANSDNSGNVTVAFEPPTRTAPADNAAVEIAAPSAIMRLTDDSQASIQLSAPVFGTWALQMMESFPS